MAPAAKAVLVLGASRGLGEAIAHAVASKGYIVGVGCRRAEDALRIAQELEEAGGHALPLTVDVEDTRSLNAAVERLRGQSQIHGLVNNAGLIDPIARLAETDSDAWARLISVNLVGAYNGIRAVLPAMTEGVVVNLSSGASATAMEGWSAYCASKAGVAMLTRCLHLEYADQGIAAYGFRPGLVDTQMQARIRESKINPISQVDRHALLPPRVPALAIAWLIDERPRDLRGQELDIRDETFSARVR